MYSQAYHKTDLSKLNILITGGAGFIGSNICEYLIKQKVGKVKLVDNLSTGFYDNIKEFNALPNCEFIEGDLTNFEFCKDICDGVDLVCHQAALGSVPRSIENPVATNHHNVTGFINIITAAKDAGIKRFVYASSSSVYGDELSSPKIEEKTGKLLSPYAVSKKTNEVYASVFNQLYEMDIIGLRYFNVFGPRQSPQGAYAAVIPLFVDGLINNKPVYIDGLGDQTRDFTFIENVVQANIKALTSDVKSGFGEVFNIACGDSISVLDLYNSISEILNIKKEPIFRNSRKGDIKNSLANISKANKLLGYNPLYSIKEGLEITVKSFRDKLVVN